MGPGLTNGPNPRLTTDFTLAYFVPPSVTTKKYFMAWTLDRHQLYSGGGRGPVVDGKIFFFDDAVGKLASMLQNVFLRLRLSEHWPLL